MTVVGDWRERVLIGRDEGSTWTPPSRAPLGARESQDLLALGPNERPLRVYSLWKQGRIDEDWLVEHLAEIWFETDDARDELDFPLPERKWLDLFSATGLTIDGERARRHTHQVHAYRGSTSSTRRGWRWYAELEPAITAAADEGDRLPADHLPDARAVWEVWAPPHAVLAARDARSSTSGRQLILGTTGLRVRLLHS